VGLHYQVTKVSGNIGPSFAKKENAIKLAKEIAEQEKRHG